METLPSVEKSQLIPATFPHFPWSLGHIHYVQQHYLQEKTLQSANISDNSQKVRDKI